MRNQLHKEELVRKKDQLIEHYQLKISKKLKSWSLNKNLTHLVGHDFINKVQKRKKVETRTCNQESYGIRILCTRLPLIHLIFKYYDIIISSVFKHALVSSGDKQETR